jgi:hypothetical protein
MVIHASIAQQIKFGMFKLTVVHALQISIGTDLLVLLALAEDIGIVSLMLALARKDKIGMEIHVSLAHKDKIGMDTIVPVVLMVKHGTKLEVSVNVHKELNGMEQHV